jgi:hypothetical protein
MKADDPLGLAGVVGWVSAKRVTHHVERANGGLRPFGPNPPYGARA